MKELYIIRGLPGSGKTTLAKELAPYSYFEADQYFTEEDGTYKFDKDHLSSAHEECQYNVGAAMRDCLPQIVVSNTFVKRWEIKPYLDMAKLYGYKVIEITMSGPLYPSVHDVPYETIDRMHDNWER